MVVGWMSHVNLRVDHHNFGRMDDLFLALDFGVDGLTDFWSIGVGRGRGRFQKTVAMLTLRVDACVETSDGSGWTDRI